MRESLRARRVKSAMLSQAAKACIAGISDSGRSIDLFYAEDIRVNARG